MNHATDILALFIGWKRSEVEQRVNEYRERTGSNVDILSGIVELDAVGLDGLYSEMIAKYGKGELVTFLSSVFSGRLMKQDHEEPRGSEDFQDRELPAYLTSLCYLVLIKHLSKDLPAVATELQALRGDILENILMSRLPFWPELLAEILFPLYSHEELSDIAKSLHKSKDAHESFIGENLLYCLAKPKRWMTHLQ